MAVRGRIRARKDRSGIALLVVIAALMFMVTLVTDIDFGTRVRFVASAHTRDASQSYWIANSGVSVMRLVLMGNKQMGKYLTSKGNSEICTMVSTMGMSCNDPLLSFLPFVNTGLMRMMFAGNGSLDEEEVEQYASDGQLSEEVSEESRESGGRFGDKNFLDFDGDFSASAEGEDCKINISGLSKHKEPLQDDPVYKMLESLMAGEENETWLRERDLTALELVGNLADWVDADSTVSSGNGSYEDNFYNRLESPYLSKNAAFDSKDEIRLVEGWQDEVFERWADKLTIYGSKKINISCTDTEVVKMMLRAYGGLTNDAEVDSAVSKLAQWKTDGNVIMSCPDFKRALSEYGGITLTADFDTNCTSKNTVYTVTSTGSVGDVLVTITAVVDQTDSDAGRVKYWRVD